MKSCESEKQKKAKESDFIFAYLRGLALICIRLKSGFAAPGAGVRLHPERGVLQRQRADAFSRHGEDGVGDGGRDRRRAGLAEAAPFVAARQDEMGLDHRRVGHAGDRVGVEIALLDPALLDRDLAEQRRRQAVEHRAFDLHRGGERIDEMAAVDAGDDALDLDLAALADRDLGDLADDGAEGLVDRHARARPLSAAACPSRP